MADTILSLKSLESIFQSITMEILGYESEDGEGNSINQDKVRMGWPQTGAPAWKITDDTVFILIRSYNDPYTRQRDAAYGEASSETDVEKEISYTRVHEVQFVVYGPNSYDNAENIRSGLYNNQDTKEALAAQNLYMILDADPPVRIPEQFNGQWWDRSDLSVRFNEKVTRKATVPYLIGTNIQVVPSK